MSPHAAGHESTYWLEGRLRFFEETRRHLSSWLFAEQDILPRHIVSLVLGLKMSVYQIDPVSDPRWSEFLQRNRRASVFHTAGWMEALRRTYGYEPVAYTTSSPRTMLDNGWVFCRVRSWLTGRRLVSLPFSDHCDPLVEGSEHLEELSRALRRERDEHRWNYIEYRPLSAQPVMKGFESFEMFCFHKLDLQPDLEQLFHGLHKDSTQRKIRRAEREGLTFDEGCSDPLLQQFYHLLVLTRQRHKVPSQPRKWFFNLADCMGDQLKIWIASCRKIPIASILTLRFKNTLMYKYGGADDRFFSLGGMQMLLWRAIENAKKNCLQEFDLGRSEPSNEGLILFKHRLGATRTSISYFRYPLGMYDASFTARRGQLRKGLLPYIPAGLLNAGGKLLYKHFG
jgi:Acetyltransferase (GNAT) domain